MGGSIDGERAGAYTFRVRLVAVLVTGDWLEAERARQVLEEAGVGCVVPEEGVFRLFPVPDARPACRVLVREEDWDEAVGVLQEAGLLEAPFSVLRSAPPACPVCGGEPEPRAGGGVVGVLGRLAGLERVGCRGCGFVWWRKPRAGRYEDGARRKEGGRMAGSEGVVRDG